MSASPRMMCSRPKMVPLLLPPLLALLLAWSGNAYTMRVQSHLSLKPSQQLYSTHQSLSTAPTIGYSRTALKAASTSEEGVALSTASKCPILRFTNGVKVIWDFTRPHTIVGSGLSVLFLYAFATPPSYWLKRVFWDSLLSSLLPALLMNIYITGLNQCTDVDIDKVNKPYLPIAAGKLSKQSGITIVIASLLASLHFARRAEWPLQMVLLGSGALGTLYSMEPFRLKRFPLLAALCILAVRGSLVNFGFIFQAKMQVLGENLPTFLTAIKTFPESLLVTVYFAIFGIVIAIMKDAPDVEGDLIYKIPSFSVRLGAGKMFRFAWKLLSSLLLFSSTACLGLLGKEYAVIGVGQRLGRFGLGGILMAIALDVRRNAIEITDSNSKKIFDFYMYTWNVFYACYALLPLLGISFFR